MDWPTRGGNLKRGSSVNDVQQLLRQQAAWQKARRNLSWPEKIRLAQKIRESVAAWRVMRKATDAHRRG
jgi:hypothetical protein